MQSTPCLNPRPSKRRPSAFKVVDDELNYMRMIFGSETGVYLVRRGREEGHTLVAFCLGISGDEGSGILAVLTMPFGPIGMAAGVDLSRLGNQQSRRAKIRSSA
eukprot:3529444-Amphidinium_carterae.2